MPLVPTDPTSAVVLGPFVAAAFDQFNSHQDELNPATIPLPAGYTLVRNIQMSDILGGAGTPRFFGYLAAGPTMQVVALRGTDTLTEWFDDVQWDLVPFTPVANGGNVAQGFFDIYTTMTTMTPGNAATTPGIAGFTAAVDPAVPLVVTGHSLGGPLTTMLVADLTANSALKPQAWSFASPKVGDAAFAARYGALSTVSWRFYNTVDLATHIPFGEDYEHVNTGYGLNSLTYAKWSVGCAHALNTYLHGLDPSIALDPGCVP
ncbi:lipase family protein [Rhodococcus spelaei]|nr:lipase family protein [Rhodococcus spelaei]